MKKLYLKTLATALLLSLNTLGASADEIGIETVNFEYANSGWSATPSSGTEVTNYTLTSTSSTISFSGKVQTQSNATINGSYTNILFVPNDALNNDGTKVITITPNDGYKIRKISMLWGGANVTNLPLTMRAYSDETNYSEKTFTGAKTATLLKDSIKCSDASYFSKVEIIKNKNANGNSPWFDVNSFIIEYVKTSTDVVLLDELSTTFPSVTSGTTVNVQLGRTFSDTHWSTFCVPFDTDENAIREAFGCYKDYTQYGGCYIKCFDTANENGRIRMVDHEFGETIKAGTPCLIKLIYYERYSSTYNNRNQLMTNPVFEGVTISSTTQPTALDCGNGVSVQGIYVKTAKSDMTSNGTINYLTTDNTKMLTLSDDGSIKGTRAYFVTSNSNAKLSLDFGDGNVTAIDAIDNEPTTDGDAPAYNLAGQRVSKSYKGIVVVNGKKVVRK